LVLHADSNFLFAATFGRGVYKMDLTALALSTTKPIINYNSIKVYPNPASEFIYADLEFNQASEFDAKLFDVNGKLVKSFKINQASVGRHLIKMDVSSLYQGIYFLKINDSNKTFKISIQ
jgi:hypothetical protein